MNTHKARRRQTAEGWRQIQTEGQGFYRFTFFTPENFTALIAAALEGDAIAAASVRAVDHMLDVINACQDPAQAPCCLLCGTPIWYSHYPAQIGVMHAACDRPTQAIAHVVCHDCDRHHPTTETFNSAVLTFYREHIMSDARMLPPASAPGHA